MSNRRFEQFNYSLVKKLVHIVGKATFQAQAKASKVIQDLTFTADAYGTGGNSISIIYTGGGTAGSEVVTVASNQISVQIEGGVSTATQVKAAIDGDVGAAALVDVAITGTGSNAQAVQSETFLAGGLDDEFVVSEAPGVESITTNGTGSFSIVLEDDYSALLSSDLSIQKSSAADLIAQMVSEDVAGAKTVSFKTLAGSTATKPVNGDKLYIHLQLRNSSIS